MAETKSIRVPVSHEIGMRVPVGGSNCAKCDYVSQDGTKCANEFFRRWNKGNVLPAKADRYCCDFFEPNEKPASLKDAAERQRAAKA